jgi:hypothetical protein
MARYRRKTTPPASETIDVAEYQPGQPLDDLAAVAARASGQVAECELPTAGRVLVARWVDYPDDHPATVQYEVVNRGEYLVFSERYDSLSTEDAAGLAHWYEPVKEGPA